MFKNRKMLLQAGVSVLLCVIVFVYILQTNLQSGGKPPEGVSPTSTTTDVLEDLPPVEFTTPAGYDGGDADTDADVGTDVSDVSE
ncbi:hypothetical protein FACS1894133_6620 [Clostridia bacterium]|nr:hypothetical protein FACS1894133_6620 [Clostridia bacterium]